MFVAPQDAPNRCHRRQREWKCRRVKELAEFSKLPDLLLPHEVEEFTNLSRENSFLIIYAQIFLRYALMRNRLVMFSLDRTYRGLFCPTFQEMCSYVRLQLFLFCFSVRSGLESAGVVTNDEIGADRDV